MSLTKVRTDLVDSTTIATTFANTVTFSSTITASNTAIFNSPINANTSLTVNASLIVKSSLNANGTNGTAGQVLTSNGSAVYWSTSTSSSVSAASLYTYSTILGRG